MSKSKFFTEKITEDQLRHFFLHLKNEKKFAYGSLRVAYSGINFFCTRECGMSRAQRWACETRMCGTSKARRYARVSNLGAHAGEGSAQPHPSPTQGVPPDPQNEPVPDGIGIGSYSNS
jgi:hypothetical protein